MTKTFKCGTRIKVLGFGWNGEETFEFATITRRTKNSAGLPDGYHPVRFDVDGGRLCVHESRFVVVDDVPEMDMKEVARLDRKIRNQFQKVDAIVRLMQSA